MKVKLKDIGTIITGNTPSKKEKSYWDSKDICFVKPDIISETGISLIEDSNEYISEAARSKARIVSKDAIFITCIGSIGKIGIACEGDYAFNQQINAIIPNEHIVQTLYLLYTIRLMGGIIRANATNGMKHIITKSVFEKIPFILPPLTLQQSFAEKIQSIEKQKEAIRASIADTQKLLDYTMDKYFG